MVRIKHRYLVANILFPSSTSTSSSSAVASSSVQASLQVRRPTPSHLTTPLLLSQIRFQISALFGDYGIGVTSSSLKMIYFSPATSTFIIRCPRAHFRLVWAALTCIEILPGTRKGETGINCVVRVVRVSGTIKKAEEDVVRRARRDIVLARTAMEGKEPSLLENLLGSGNHPEQSADGLRGIEDDDEDDDVDVDVEDESD